MQSYGYIWGGVLYSLPKTQTNVIVGSQISGKTNLHIRISTKRNKIAILLNKKFKKNVVTVV